MADHLRKKKAIICTSTTEMLSKVDDKLSKFAAYPDMLEELK